MAPRAGHAPRLAVLGWALALPVLPCGCATFEGNPALVPIVEVYDDAAGTPFPLSSLFPSTEPSPRPEGGVANPQAEPPRPIATPAAREVAVRPLGSIAFAGADRRRIRILWPIADFSRVEEERRGWVLPVWYRQVKAEPGGGWSRRWMVLPFLFGGRSSEGAYFAVFPLAGKIRGLLGQDEIDLYALPVYWRSRFGEQHSLHLFFPFYNSIWGGGRSGARLWPFYGRYRAETADGRARYDRSFVLWPLYFDQKNDLNTAAPSRLIFFFPFFGQSESERTLTRTYLWPLFNTTLDKRTGKKTYFGFVFPYRFAEGQFDLWPLFGVKRAVEETPMARVGPRRRHRHFVLWPIERFDRSEDDERISSRFWLLPFYWRFHDRRKADGAEELEWKLWPLLRYRRVGGETDLHLPSPLWFRQEKPIERLYARLWQLFLYRKTADQEGWEALFALLSYRNQKPEDRRTFAVLGGLFSLSWGGEGTRFRFFYLPWR